VNHALCGGEFRADGYYIATFGEGGSWEGIERYVLNQGKPKDELQKLKLFKYLALLVPDCLFCHISLVLWLAEHLIFYFFQDDVAQSRQFQLRRIHFYRECVSVSLLATRMAIT
jgi:hypothetical protein